MNTTTAVANRLLELCRERKLSINMLSRMASVRQSTVNDIVNGVTRNPGIVTLKKLCDALGITLVQFFDTDVFRSLEQEIR